jgi:phytol kinase
LIHGFGDVIGAAILMVSLGIVLIGGELWARLGTPDPETSRKFVHLASAGVCLLFPVLVESPWVVGALAVGMAAFFAVTSRYKLLASVHGVDRSSRGSEYYPLAIFLVFLLSGDQIWIYFASVLVLGVADACAALVGVRYGRVRYRVEEGEKSLEGSLAFFGVAFVAVGSTAWIFTDLPILEVVNISITTAALLTAFEAISMKGSDNLFIPVAAAVMLEKLAVDSLFELTVQNAMLAATSVGLALGNYLVGKATPKRHLPFDTGGILALTLFAYAAWALGSLEWVLPIFLGYLLCMVAWTLSWVSNQVQVTLRIRTTYRALLLPFAALIVSNIFELYAVLFGPYLAALAVMLAFVVNALLRPEPGARFYSKRLSSLVGAVTAVWVVVPAYLLDGAVGWRAPVLIVVMTTLACVINTRITDHAELEGASFWPASNLALTVVVTGVVFAAQHEGWISQWSPPAASEMWRTVMNPGW